MHPEHIQNGGKTVPSRPMPVVTTTTRTKINSILFDYIGLDGNKKSLNDTVGDKHYLCRVLRQIGYLLICKQRYWSGDNALGS